MNECEVADATKIHITVDKRVTILLISRRLSLHILRCYSPGGDTCLVVIVTVAYLSHRCHRILLLQLHHLHRRHCCLITFTLLTIESLFAVLGTMSHHIVSNRAVASALSLPLIGMSHDPNQWNDWLRSMQNDQSHSQPSG